MRTDEELLETEFTEEDARRSLKRPDSFAYFGDRRGEMFVTWCLGPIIETRDSGILDKSNADVLRKRLEAIPEFEGQYEIERASHWAVGWVDHLSFRVLDGDGKPTPIARYLKGWFEYLKDVYPIADEDDFSQQQLDAELDYFDQQWRHLDGLKDDLPEDAGAKVHEKLRDSTDPHEDSDAIPYYDEEQILAAAKELGYTQ